MKCYVETVNGKLVDVNEIIYCYPKLIGQDWVVEVTLPSRRLGDGYTKILSGKFNTLEDAESFMGGFYVS